MGIAASVDSIATNPATPPARELSTTVERLCDLSVKAFRSPWDQVEWPGDIPAEAWCSSPELLSLYGTSRWDALDEAQRRRLAFFETVNFFSLNIHGEKALLEGLTRRLYKKGSSELSPYLHHFIEEENKHMLLFGTFCRKYAGKVYPDRKLSLPREYAPGEEELLFFLKVMIFEEVVDSYNLHMAKDERLHPLLRRINLLHHQDETRHLAFGRLLCRHLYAQHSPSWSAETRKGVAAYAAAYLEATWKEYYNPDVYRDAGIADPYGAAREAWSSEAGRAHRARLSARCTRVLAELDLAQEVT